MRYVRLVAITDEYDSTPGLVQAATPRFERLQADRTGLLLAHDILEHQNGPTQIGQIWDELQALGGVWHVRGQNGHFKSRWYTAHQNVGGDVMTLMTDAEDTSYRAPHTTRPVPYYDDDFHEIIAYARANVVPDEHSVDLDDFCAHALHNLRIGFRKAQRRNYEPILFDLMSKKLAEISIDYEGQEFILGYSHDYVTVREHTA